MPTTHELKTAPEEFDATWKGLKPFELRKDDRPDTFKEGDLLTLREYHLAHDHYSGRQIDATVLYVLRGCLILPRGCVIMAIRPLSNYQK